MEGGGDKGGRGGRGKKTGGSLQGNQEGEIDRTQQALQTINAEFNTN